MELKGQLDPKEMMVELVIRVILELKVKMEQRVRMVLEEILVKWDQEDIQVKLDLEDSMVKLDILVIKVKMVRLVKMVQQEK
jgi:hypothetical protein